MQSHGIVDLRVSNPPTSPFQGYGRFGRLFPALYPFHPEDADLKELGKAGGLMDEGDADPATRDNPDIPSGFTFLGQFIDHDVTLDVTSSLERQNDPEALYNFRTPFLELDNIYGLGPDNQPYLYDQQDKGKLLIAPAKPATGSDPATPRDLIRIKGRAVIGDPRNDENLIIAQLQFAFISFHNKAVDRLRSQGFPEKDLFQQAQKLVRWHYQYIVVNEFLPLICGKHVVENILKNGRQLYQPEKYPYYEGDPFMPVEFSVAAYRYGHSQVRSKYKLNTGPEIDLFGMMGAFRPLKISELIDWHNFFAIDGGTPAASRKIDERLAHVLFNLPFTNDPDPALNSLAARNLLRGKAFCLPSGQTIARFLQDRIDGAPKIYTQAEMGLSSISGLKETPLWYYLLKEASIENGGKHLGRLGGRIVAEVILGLLQLDLMSYVYLEPSWKPDFAVAGKWNMAELLKFAAMV